MSIGNNLIVWSLLNMDLIPLFIVALMAFIQFLGEKFSEHIESFHIEMVSFGAGLLIATFFLEVLPQVMVGEEFLHEWLYLALLVGFIGVHLTEKIVYRRAVDEREVEIDTNRFEAGGLAMYSLGVGFIITVLYQNYGDSSFFIFIPFFVRAFTISIPSSHINEMIGNNINRILQLIAPFAGVFLASFLVSDKTQLFLIFSITTGAILYVFIRDMIPRGKRGNPVLFIIGALTTTAIFLIFHIM
jgi:hypothetical protein